MQIWALSDAKQDLIGFTLVVQMYSGDVCYYLCVCACVHVPMRVYISVDLRQTFALLSIPGM